jgi:hypothetical protein
MRKRRGVGLAEIIICILIALGFVVLAWRNEEMDMVLRFIFVFVAIVFLAIAIVGAVMWVQYNQALIDEQRQYAYSRSERVRLASELARMNADQLDAFLKYNVTAYEIISGTGGPLMLWRCIGGGFIDRPFLEKYLNMGDDRNLYPVRNLDKTEQEKAMRFIVDASQRDWVRMPAGNQPAQWTNKAEALFQIFGPNA